MLNPIELMEEMEVSDDDGEGSGDEDRLEVNNTSSAPGPLNPF